MYAHMTIFDTLPYNAASYAWSSAFVSTSSELALDSIPASCRIVLLHVLNIRILGNVVNGLSLIAYVLPSYPEACYDQMVQRTPKASLFLLLTNETCLVPTG